MKLIASDGTVIERPFPTRERVRDLRRDVEGMLQELNAIAEEIARLRADMEAER